MLYSIQETFGHLSPISYLKFRQQVHNYKSSNFTLASFPGLLTVHCKQPKTGWSQGLGMRLLLPIIPQPRGECMYIYTKKLKF